MKGKITVKGEQWGISFEHQEGDYTLTVFANGYNCVPLQSDAMWFPTAGHALHHLNSFIINGRMPENLKSMTIFKLGD